MDDLPSLRKVVGSLLRRTEVFSGVQHSNISSRLSYGRYNDSRVMRKTLFHLGVYPPGKEALIYFFRLMSALEWQNKQQLLLLQLQVLYQCLRTFEAPLKKIHAKALESPIHFVSDINREVYV